MQILSSYAIGKTKNDLWSRRIGARTRDPKGLRIFTAKSQNTGRCCNFLSGDFSHGTCVTSDRRCISGTHPKITQNSPSNDMVIGRSIEALRWVSASSFAEVSCFSPKSTRTCLSLTVLDVRVQTVRRYYPLKA